MINIGDNYISLDKIKINQPKNVEITYIIPERLFLMAIFQIH